MRLFERSATYTRPLESIAMLWGMSNWPGSVPLPPHHLMNLPVLGELHDARVGAFAVGDEDVAVLRHGEVRHAVEGVLRVVAAE